MRNLRLGWIFSGPLISENTKLCFPFDANQINIFTARKILLIAWKWPFENNLKKIARVLWELKNKN